MSLLGRIFGGPVAGNKNAGPLGRLLRRRVERLPFAECRSRKDHCLSIFAPVLEFGQHDQSPDVVLARYTSDACLFELACYILVSTDFWVFNNAPDKRAEIQDLLFFELAGLSEWSGFLSNKKAYAFSNSRVDLYGRIAADATYDEGLLGMLRQAVLHAGKRKKPSKDLAATATTSGDPVTDSALSQALLDWDLCLMKKLDAPLWALT